MIGEDANFVELSSKLAKDSDRNNPFVGTGVVVSVILNVVATMNAIGDGHRIRRSDQQFFQNCR